MKLIILIYKVAVKCMPFYAKYFGIPYDLPKLDMIAVSELSFGDYN
jgi:aminopeptidase N